MIWHTREQAAERAGVEPSDLDRLVELGILAPEAPDRFTAGDVRRAMMVGSLEEAGIAPEGVAAAIRSGALPTLAFLDAPTYERFAAIGDETFREVSGRSGIPLELLAVIREAIGFAPPAPDDRLRLDELAIVPFVELQVAEGFAPAAVERLLRVVGDSTRRIAEQEAAWWRSQVIEPAIAAGRTPESIGNLELGKRSTPLAEQALLACTTPSRRAPGRPTSSKASRRGWRGPACTAASSIRQPCASSTSRATRGSPSSAATRRRRISRRRWRGWCGGARCSMAASRSSGSATG
jgi:hypothetical protein